MTISNELQYWLSVEQNQVIELVQSEQNSKTKKKTLVKEDLKLM